MEKIRLRVPSKPAANEVSHGNFHAVLTPKAVIEVDNRRFADWLVREYALAEVDAEASVETEETEAQDKIGGKK